MQRRKANMIRKNDDIHRKRLNPPCPPHNKRRTDCRLRPGPANTRCKTGYPRRHDIPPAAPAVKLAARKRALAAVNGILATTIGEHAMPFGTHAARIGTPAIPFGTHAARSGTPAVRIGEHAMPFGTLAARIGTPAAASGKDVTVKTLHAAAERLSAAGHRALSPEFC